MTKLNPKQITLLTDAAGDGVPADTADGRVAGPLIKRGLLIALPRDGKPRLLSTTREGRDAASLPNSAPRASRDLKPKPAAADTAAPADEAKPASRTAALRALLERPEGATVSQMTEATGWLPHSVRGFMAGSLKKKLGLTVMSEKSEAGRIYRIVEPA